MTEITNIVQQQIEAALASSLIKEITEENLVKIIREVMNKNVGSGWNSEPFFKYILKTFIEDMIRDTLSVRIIEQEPIIKQAVEKVVTEDVMKKIADSLQCQMSKYLTVKIET